MAKRKRVRKAKAVKVKRKIKKKVERKIELSTLTKNILWSLVLGSDTISSISEALNMDKERIRDEVDKLLNAELLRERGSFIRGYDLTTKGFETLGSPTVKLETSLSDSSIKSGDHTKLTVSATNIGEMPITNATVRLTSPIFIKIARYGSRYYQDAESSVINFDLTQLNPRETQTLEFNLHGNLTSGTLSSRYKIFVEALIGDMTTDKKELGIVVER